MGCSGPGSPGFHGEFLSSFARTPGRRRLDGLTSRAEADDRDGRYHPHDMLLVSDDRSDDSTLEVVRAVGGDRVRVAVNGERLGLAGNWNRCAAMCRTPLLAIFHQDDVMEPGHLAAHAAVLARDETIGLVAGASTVIDELGRPVPADAPEMSPSWTERHGADRVGESFREAWERAWQQARAMNQLWNMLLELRQAALPELNELYAQERKAKEAGEGKEAKRLADERKRRAAGPGGCSQRAHGVQLDCAFLRSLRLALMRHA